MSRTSLIPPAETRPARPLGVWIFTMYSMFYDGILPLGLAVMLLLQQDFDLTATNAIAVGASALLSLGVIIAAIFTWKGNPTAKLWFLILVTVYNALLVFNYGYQFYTGQIDETASFTITGRMIRGVLFPIIYWYYFNRESVKRFFRPNNEETI